MMIIIILKYKYFHEEIKCKRLLLQDSFFCNTFVIQTVFLSDKDKIRFLAKNDIKIHLKKERKTGSGVGSNYSPSFTSNFLLLSATFFSYYKSILYKDTSLFIGISNIKRYRRICT